MKHALLVAPVLSAVRALRKALGSGHSAGFLADAVPRLELSEATLVGPVIGASATALVCEPLLASVDRCVLLGVCGAYGTSLEGACHGDVILPREFLRDDGTSERLGAPSRLVVEPSASALALQSELELESLRPRAGVVLSTDTPFLGDAMAARERAERGAHAVDMECGVLAWLCAQKGVELAAALVVTDVFAERWYPGFKKKETTRSLEAAARAIGRMLVSEPTG